jgi:hypothetical protein
VTGVRRLLAASALPLALAASRLEAQGYSLRLDSRIQHAAFRGVVEDSVPASEVVTGPSGGLVTPDGIAVSCDPGGTCRFFRPGPALTAAPFSQSASLTAWGFGMRGLSAHAEGRLLTDLSAANAWPGSEPPLQLLEGYLEHASLPLTIRLGRQMLVSRLGATGFDGLRAQLRVGTTGVDLDVYGGWGLARATALPVTSPALNPLDEYRPSQRARVYSMAVGYAAPIGSVRAEYQRQLDGRSHYLVSDQAAISADARVSRRLSLTGGAAYDIAGGHWGSADMQARYVGNAVTLAVATRRYRPHFDLWTIWGAFSPVPFTAVSGAVWVRPHARLELRARGERYWFSPADASTPLVQAEDAGWRASAGASLDIARRWRIELDAQKEFGPGAASRGVDAGVTFSPRPGLELAARGGALQRPLEFRYDDATVSNVGMDADWRLSDRVHAGAGVTRYWETRDRPDAAAFDWAQTRVNARLTLLFGGAGALPLPPGRRPAPTGAAP